MERIDTELVVIGAGPGGYVSAIRAADLGMETVLVEEREHLGGVCLLEGCIPSKTLLSIVQNIEWVKRGAECGVFFSDVRIDLEALRNHTKKIVYTLSKGINELVRKRGIKVVHDRVTFRDVNTLFAFKDEKEITFRKCIIAVGSKVIMPDFARDAPVWTSREALNLEIIPETLLIVGGGYIGLEMGMIYAGLGSKVTVVELTQSLLPGIDEDLVRVLTRSIKKRFESILLESRVEKIKEKNGRFFVSVRQRDTVKEMIFDRVLVAVGRTPNINGLGLEKIPLKVNGKGFIEISKECMTNIPNICAIGDVTEGPMLAHRASSQGKIAAEVLSGHKPVFFPKTCPSVVFTDPEIAFVGLTERECKEMNIDANISKFNFSALGRAVAVGRTEGHAKVLSDPKTSWVLGVGIVGSHASELIAEACLAVETGLGTDVLSGIIHPHPTFSESLMEAFEVAQQRSVHVHRSMPKNK